MREFWLCDDCRIFAVNADLTPIDFSYSGEAAETRAKRVTEGCARLGYIVHDGEQWGDGWEEHSIDPCDACGDRAHGERWRFKGAATIASAHSRSSFGERWRFKGGEAD